MKILLWSLFSILLKLFSLLPLPLLYIVFKPIYWLLFYVIKYRRKVVRNNLVNSFPEKNKSELLKIEKGYYKYLSNLFAETIKCISISETEIKKRVKLRNPEMFDYLNANHKAAIVLLGHLGNWEMIALSSSFMSKHHDFYIVYKRIHHSFWDKMMFNTRSRFGANLVRMEETYTKIKELQFENTIFTLVSDQNPSNIKNSYWTTFLNQETVFLSGPEILSKKFKIPILYLDVYCYKSGYYEIELKVLIEDYKQNRQQGIIELYAKALEESIRRKPETWLWSHKRWKHKKT